MIGYRKPFGLEPKADSRKPPCGKLGPQRLMQPRERHIQPSQPVAAVSRNPSYPLTFRSVGKVFIAHNHGVDLISTFPELD
jgi:hypothetical protein